MMGLVIVHLKTDHEPVIGLISTTKRKPIVMEKEEEDEEEEEGEGVIHSFKLQMVCVWRVLKY